MHKEPLPKPSRSAIFSTRRLFQCLDACGGKQKTQIPAIAFCAFCIFNSRFHNGSKDERPATKKEGAPKRRSDTGFSLSYFQPQRSVARPPKKKSDARCRYVSLRSHVCCWLTNKQMNEKPMHQILSKQTAHTQKE
jgi:hypothetical protein